MMCASGGKEKFGAPWQQEFGTKIRRSPCKVYYEETNEMKIMVVDDEKVQIESIMRGLRNRKFGVVEALNGEEALRHLDDTDNSIDMVLTDYSMPGMNGIELLRRIREKDSALPVIIMTAYGDKDLVIDAMRNECDSFIEKPFTPDLLMKEINRVMQKALEKKKSRELSRAIPTFVHQMNNPLFSISAGAELALLNLDNDDSGALKVRMNRIIKATEKIAEINRELRNLGRETHFNFENLYIHEVLDECIDMFDDMLKLKGISMEKKFHNNGCMVSGNRFELEQVFKNLILNAVDAMDGMPNKQLEILSELNENGPFLSVQIADTGCGISDEALKKIFTPYYTTKEKGTGLGLGIIKGILEKHNGTIDVKSVVDQGTTFEVKLRVVSMQ